MSDAGRKVGVIGVPTSAGAFAPGQEQAPAALRQAGLVQLLRDSGVEVSDYGDREGWRWRPDRERPNAQNLPWVVEIIDDTAARVVESVLAEEITVVLGGDCTVGIGTVAGHVERSDSVGLIYFDLHADLNIPTSAPPGALDWMGMAHMLGDEGAERELVEVGSRVPLLAPDQVVLLAWGPEQARPHERETIDRLELEAIPVDEVRDDPAGAGKGHSTSSPVQIGYSSTSTSTWSTSPTPRSRRTRAGTRGSPTSRRRRRWRCCSPRPPWPVSR